MQPMVESSCKPYDWGGLCSDELYRFALIRFKNRLLAEDFVQGTFVSALSKLNSSRGDSTEKTWLYTIVRNKIID